jgi:hypothetical protein
LCGSCAAISAIRSRRPRWLLRPLLDADKPPATIEIRRALKTLENAVTQYIHDARLAPAS